MKKWFIRVIVIFALLGGGLLTIILSGEFDQAVTKRYVKNKSLQTIKADSKGTPVDQKGRFVNLEFPFLPSTVELLKWQLSTNPQKEEKQVDAVRLAVGDPTDFLSGSQDGILWLGHAGFFYALGCLKYFNRSDFRQTAVCKYSGRCSFSARKTEKC